MSDLNIPMIGPPILLHVSVSDLYIPTIGPLILLQQNRKNNRLNIYVAYRYMSVGLGTRPQFHFWEYLFQIFGTVQCLCIVYCHLTGICIYVKCKHCEVRHTPLY